MNILITGTSSGIGYGLAKEYLNRNAKVWGVSRRKPDNLLNNPNYRHLQLDLTQSNEVEKQIPGFTKGITQFDLLILNSGVLGGIKNMNEV